MKKAIVVVDMQRDFVRGSLGTAEAQVMLPHLVDKLKREEGADLFFTLDTHDAGYLHTQEGKNLPVAHCIKPGPGWEVVEELAPFLQKAVAAVEKPTFGSTRLPALLAAYDAIEFVGLCTDICVISNALIVKAFHPEKRISVDASCCAGVTPESHKNALAAMKMCQIEVTGEEM